jgi:hypothetical protein
MTDEPFDCDACGRRIGANRLHFYTENDKICCPCCAGLTWKSSTPTHAVIYPDCRLGWHDMHDHQSIGAHSRAAARWIVSQGGYAAALNRKDTA